jgi:hypothetical protein
MNDFDWVSALSKCSLAGIFEQLKEQVADDVEKRKSMGGGEGYEVTISANRIAVINKMAELGVIRNAVVILLTEGAIEVQDKDRQMKFKGTPTLNEKGECRLQVAGKETEFWHFRKMALEDLFFGNG